MRMDNEHLDQNMERNPQEHVLDNFVEEIEAELADLDLSGPPVENQAAATTAAAEDPGYQQMLDTFRAIMRDALRPVTRYVKAIKLGEKRRGLYEIIWLTVIPLLEKVQQVGLVEEAAKLEDFVDATERIIHAREVLQRMRFDFFMTYAVLQDTFRLEYRGNRQAVNNLLLFYEMIDEDDRVSEDDLRRFFAMGIPSLTWVRKTPTQEIASLSGMSREGIQRLKQVVRHFRHEREMYAAEKWEEEREEAVRDVAEKPQFVTV